MTFKERRKANRVDANLSITISGEKGAALGKTLNISTNGVYFRSPYLIELLTKVRLDLVIPVSGSDGVREKRVTCDGVVVRAEPEHEDQDSPGFLIAVFFTYVSESSHEALAGYIKSRIEN